MSRGYHKVDTECNKILGKYNASYSNQQVRFYHVLIIAWNPWGFAPKQNENLKFLALFIKLHQHHTKKSPTYLVIHLTVFILHKICLRISKNASHLTSEVVKGLLKRVGDSNFDFAFEEILKKFKIWIKLDGIKGFWSRYFT